MVTEKTGGIVGVKVVDGSEDLLLVTRAGILIRTPVEAIRTTGRATQGVIVMRFKEEGDSVISWRSQSMRRARSKLLEPLVPLRGTKPHPPFSFPRKKTGGVTVQKKGV